MRAAIAFVLLAACSPSIAPGSYECGPEQLCPEGEACNGPDGMCVTAAIAEPFACGDVAGDVEPNDTFDTASTALGADACVTLPTQITGCVNASDREDWYQLHVKDSCTTPQIEARLVFPIAFEPLLVEVRAADGSTVASGTDCAGTSDAFGDHSTCVKAGVAAGGSYAVHVVRAGVQNCGGACAYNRYTTTIQLTQGN
jgi:hypothetical protein